MTATFASRLALAGINHRTAPVELREKVAFGDAEIPAALSHVQAGGAAEALVVSTCNRIELTTVIGADSAVDALLEHLLFDVKGVGPEQVRPHIYTFEDRDAIRHLFRVAGSLDSMIVGEPQILGQLKQAYHRARDNGSVGAILESVLTRAFHAAKRIRTETEIGQSAVSVGYAAVELAREIFGTLDGKRVLVIGAGKMSENAARHLLRAGAHDILITNRTGERARDLADLLRGTAVPYETFTQRLPEIDIVLASTGAAGPVLMAHEVGRALELRKNRPMFLIDVAVPRNIDTAVNRLEHAFLYDLDDLQRLAERNLQARAEVARAAEQIVDEEIRRLEGKLRTRDVGPTIVSLQQELETIRQDTVDRFRTKLGPLSLDQVDAIETMTRALVNKIAHGPISEIRRHASSQDTPSEGNEIELLSAVRRMFRLRDR